MFESYVSLLLIFNFGLAQEYRVIYQSRVVNNPWPRHGKIYVSVEGKGGRSKPVECWPLISITKSARTCNFKNENETIGNFRRLIIDNQSSAAFSFTKLEIDIAGDPHPKRFYVSRSNFERVESKKEGSFYFNYYYNGSDQWTDSSWYPDPRKGDDHLASEYSYMFWIFQTLTVPPFFVLLILIFSIVACVRGKICSCCNSRVQSYTNQPMVTIQA